ncbi:WXG100-like domain-containing protein [Nocardia aobensis]|uniref:WXG100-like domain-containing protein n=1 Tax=Nocardia aobensis TaxID=257277 RepID=UPI0002D3C811|nr:hypothetical protein [Nocardia aobensis]
MTWSQYSNIELPQWLPHWVMEIAGGDFPQALDGTMLRTGDLIRPLAQEWEELASDLSSVVDQLESWSGAAVDQMVIGGRQLYQVTGELGKAYESLARQLSDGGTDIRETKIVIAVTAVEIAAQAGAAVVAAVVNPAAGALELAAKEASLRKSVRVARDKLLDILLAKGARAAAQRRGLLLPFEAAMGATQALLPQVVGMGVTGHWSGDRLRDAAIAGAAGGVVGGTAGIRVGEGAGRMIARSQAAGLSRKALIAGSGVASAVLGGAAGGAAGIAASSVARLETPKLGDLLSGAGAGAAAGVVFGAGGVVTGLRTPSGPVPNGPRAALAGKSRAEIAKLLAPRFSDTTPMTSTKLAEYQGDPEFSSHARPESDPRLASDSPRVPARASGPGKPPGPPEPEHTSARGDASGRRGNLGSTGEDAKPAVPPDRKRPSAEDGDSTGRVLRRGSEGEAKKGAVPAVGGKNGKGATPTVDEGSGGASSSERKRGHGGPLSPPARHDSPPTGSKSPIFAAKSSPEAPEKGAVTAKAVMGQRERSVDADPKPAESSPAGIAHSPGESRLPAPEAGGEGPIPGDQRGAGAEPPIRADGVGDSPLPGTAELSDAEPPQLPEAAERAQEWAETEQWCRAYRAFDENFGAMPKEALLEWLQSARSTDEERHLAAVEITRRITRDTGNPEGIVLRPDQLYGARRMTRNVVELRPGGGKTAMFLVHNLVRLGRGQTVHFMTNAPDLADREFEMYDNIAGSLGYDTHRVQSDAAMANARPGRGAIFVGTPDDYAHAFNKGNWHRADAVVIDEFDAVVKWMNGLFVLSEGTSAAAPPEVQTYIRSIQECFSDAIAQGKLSEADFTHPLDQPARGRPPEFTADGLEKARTLLAEWFEPEHRNSLRTAADAMLRKRAEWMREASREGKDEDLARLRMAMQAHWYHETRRNDAYVVEELHPYGVDELHGYGVEEIGLDGTSAKPAYEKKVLLINESTGHVNYDVETGMESRWSRGLAEAVEAKEGLTIRDSARTLSETTIVDLLKKYDEVTGASGTAFGASDVMRAELNMAAPEEVKPPWESRLEREDPIAAGARHAQKMEKMSDDIVDEFLGKKTLPQLVVCDRNSEVAELSRLVRAKLTKRGVLNIDDALSSVDAHTQIHQDQLAAKAAGANFKEHWAAITKTAGEPVEVRRRGSMVGELGLTFTEKRGKIVIANRIASRGTDVKISAEVEAKGGLLVRASAMSILSPDLDKQVYQRAGRIGEVFAADGKTVEYKSQRGRAVFYLSSDDALFDSSDPYAAPIVEHYSTACKANAEKSTPASRARLAVTGQWLGALAHHLQQAAHPAGGVTYPGTGSQLLEGGTATPLTGAASQVGAIAGQPAGTIAEPSAAVGADRQAQRHDDTTESAGVNVHATQLADALSGELTAPPDSGNAAATTIAASRSAPISTVPETLSAVHTADGRVPVHWITTVEGGRTQPVHGYAVNDHGVLTLTLTTSPAPTDLISETADAAIAADRLHDQLTRHWAGLGGAGVRVHSADKAQLMVAGWDIPLSDAVTAGVSQLDKAEETVASAQAAIDLLEVGDDVPAELVQLLTDAMAVGRGLFAGNHPRGKAIDDLKANLGTLPASALKHEAAVALSAIGNQSQVCRRRLGEQAARQVTELAGILTADGAIESACVPATVTLKPSQAQDIFSYSRMLEARLPKDDPRYSGWLAKTKVRLSDRETLSRTEMREIAIGISDLVGELADGARTSTIVTLNDGRPEWHLPAQRTTESDGIHGQGRLMRELTTVLRLQPVAGIPADPEDRLISDVVDIAELVHISGVANGRWILKDTQEENDLREWAVHANTGNDGVLHVSMTAHRPSEETITCASDGVTAIPIDELFGRLTRAWAGQGGTRVELSSVGRDLMSWDIAPLAGRAHAARVLRTVESTVRTATEGLQSSRAQLEAEIRASMSLPAEQRPAPPSLRERQMLDITALHGAAAHVEEALQTGRDLFAADSALSGRIDALLAAARAPNMTVAQAKEIEVALATIGARVVGLRYLLGVEAENATGRIAQLAGVATAGPVDLTGAGRTELLQRAEAARGFLDENDSRGRELDQILSALRQLDRDKEKGGLELPSLAGNLTAIVNQILEDLRRRPSTVFHVDENGVVWTAAADTADSAAEDNVTTLLAAHEAVWLDVAWQSVRDDVAETVLAGLNASATTQPNSARFYYDGVNFRQRGAVAEDGPGPVSLADLLADPAKHPGTQQAAFETLRNIYGLDVSERSKLVTTIRRFRTLDRQRRRTDTVGALRLQAQLAAVADPGRAREIHARLMEDIDTGRAAELLETLAAGRVKSGRATLYQALGRIADKAADPTSARQQYYLLADLDRTDRGRTLLEELAGAVPVSHRKARELAVELAFAAAVLAGRQHYGVDQETIVRLPQWCVVMSLLTLNQSAYLVTGNRMVGSPQEAIGRAGTEAPVSSFLAGAHHEFIGEDSAAAFEQIAAQLGCGRDASLAERIGASGRKVVVHVEYPRTATPDTPGQSATGSRQYRPAGDDFTILNHNGVMVAVALVDGRIVEFTEAELADGLKFWMTSFDEQGTAAKPFLSGPVDEEFDELAEDQAAQDSYIRSLRELADRIGLTSPEQEALTDPDRYRDQLDGYVAQFGPEESRQSQIALVPSGGNNRTMSWEQFEQLAQRVRDYQQLTSRIRAASGTVRPYSATTTGEQGTTRAEDDNPSTGDSSGTGVVRDAAPGPDNPTTEGVGPGYPGAVGAVRRPSDSQFRPPTTAPPPVSENTDLARHGTVLRAAYESEPHFVTLLVTAHLSGECAVAMMEYLDSDSPQPPAAMPAMVARAIVALGVPFSEKRPQWEEKDSRDSTATALISAAARLWWTTFADLAGRIGADASIEPSDLLARARNRAGDRTVAAQFAARDVEHLFKMWPRILTAAMSEGKADLLGKHPPVSADHARRGTGTVIPDASGRIDAGGAARRGDREVALSRLDDLPPIPENFTEWNVPVRGDLATAVETVTKLAQHQATVLAAVRDLLVSSSDLIEELGLAEWVEAGAQPAMLDRTELEGRIAAATRTQRPRATRRAVKALEEALAHWAEIDRRSKAAQSRADASAAEAAAEAIGGVELGSSARLVDGIRVEVFHRPGHVGVLPHLLTTAMDLHAGSVITREVRVDAAGRVLVQNQPEPVREALRRYHKLLLDARKEAGEQLTASQATGASPGRDDISSRPMLKKWGQLIAVTEHIYAKACEDVDSAFPAEPDFALLPSDRQQIEAKMLAVLQTYAVALRTVRMQAAALAAHEWRNLLAPDESKPPTVAKREEQDGRTALGNNQTSTRSEGHTEQAKRIGNWAALRSSQNEHGERNYRLTIFSPRAEDETVPRQWLKALTLHGIEVKFHHVQVDREGRTVWTESFHEPTEETSVDPSEGLFEDPEILITSICARLDVSLRQYGVDFTRGGSADEFTEPWQQQSLGTTIEDLARHIENCASDRFVRDRMRHAWFRLRAQSDSEVEQENPDVETARIHALSHAEKLSIGLGKHHTAIGRLTWQLFALTDSPRDLKSAQRENLHLAARSIEAEQDRQTEKVLDTIAESLQSEAWMQRGRPSGLEEARNALAKIEQWRHQPHPSAMNACVSWITGILHALGNSKGIARPNPTDRLLGDIERNIQAGLQRDHEIHKGDPVRRAAARLAASDDDDTVAVVVSKGERAHAYVLTKFDSTIWIYDNLIEGKKHRVREFEADKWQPKYRKPDYAYYATFESTTEGLVAKRTPAESEVESGHRHQEVTGPPDRDAIGKLRKLFRRGSHAAQPDTTQVADRLAREHGFLVSGQATASTGDNTPDSSTADVEARLAWQHGFTVDRASALDDLSSSQESRTLNSRIMARVDSIRDWIAADLGYLSAKAGLIVNSMGTQLATAAATEIYAKMGSGLAGLRSLDEVAMVLFLLFAGNAADRHESTKLARRADMWGAITAVMAGTAVLFGGPFLGLTLAGTLLLQGISAAYSEAANGSTLKALAGKARRDALVRFQSVLQNVIRSSALALTPFLLLVFGPVALFYANAASFAVNALLTRLQPKIEPPDTSSDSTRVGIARAASDVVHDLHLRSSALANAAGNWFTGVGQITAGVATWNAGLPWWEISLALLLGPFAGMLGSTISGRYFKDKVYTSALIRRIVSIKYVGIAAAAAIQALVGDPILSSLALAIGWGVHSFTLLPLNTLRRRVAPPAVSQRIDAITGALNRSASILGGIIGGALLVVDFRLAVGATAAAAVGFLGAGALVQRFPQLSQLRSIMPGFLGLRGPRRLPHHPLAPYLNDRQIADFQRLPQVPISKSDEVAEWQANLGVVPVRDRSAHYGPSKVPSKAQVKLAKRAFKKLQRGEIASMLQLGGQEREALIICFPWLLADRPFGFHETAAFSNAACEQLLRLEAERISTIPKGDRTAVDRQKLNYLEKLWEGVVKAEEDARVRDPDSKVLFLRLSPDRLYAWIGIHKRVPNGEVDLTFLRVGPDDVSDDAWTRLLFEPEVAAEEPFAKPGRRDITITEEIPETGFYQISVGPLGRDGERLTAEEWQRQAAEAGQRVAQRIRTYGLTEGFESEQIEESIAATLLKCGSISDGEVILTTRVANRTIHFDVQHTGSEPPDSLPLPWATGINSGSTQGRSYTCFELDKSLIRHLLPPDLRDFCREFEADHPITAADLAAETARMLENKKFSSFEVRRICSGIETSPDLKPLPWLGDVVVGCSGVLPGGRKAFAVAAPGYRGLVVSVEELPWARDSSSIEDPTYRDETRYSRSPLPGQKNREGIVEGTAKAELHDRIVGTVSELAQHIDRENKLRVQILSGLTIDLHTNSFVITAPRINTPIEGSFRRLGDILLVAAWNRVESPTVTEPRKIRDDNPKASTGVGTTEAGASSSPRPSIGWAGATAVPPAVDPGALQAAIDRIVRGHRESKRGQRADGRAVAQVEPAHRIVPQVTDATYPVRPWGVTPRILEQFALQVPVPRPGMGTGGESASHARDRILASTRSRVLNSLARVPGVTGRDSRHRATTDLGSGDELVRAHPGGRCHRHRKSAGGRPAVDPLRGAREERAQKFARWNASDGCRRLPGYRIVAGPWDDR